MKDRICRRGHEVTGDNKKIRASNPSYAACRKCEQDAAKERRKLKE